MMTPNSERLKAEIRAVEELLALKKHESENQSCNEMMRAHVDHLLAENDLGHLNNVTDIESLERHLKRLKADYSHSQQGWEYDM